MPFEIPPPGSCAGIYWRVSLDRQEEGHSPEIQRATLLKIAEDFGYVVAIADHDVERGGRVTRSGYNQIVQAVRRREIRVVLVYSLSRWGRNAPERLARGEEFDRLGAAVYAAQEGWDEPGIKRALYAGLDEDYSRRLAKNVRPARER